MIAPFATSVTCYNFSHLYFFYSFIFTTENKSRNQWNTRHQLETKNHIYVIFSRQFLKGKLHPKPKLSMFCALFQNYQHFFWKIIWSSWSKFSGKLKNGIKITLGPTILELLVDVKYCFDKELKNCLTY